jgi:hypothetical protein
LGAWSNSAAIPSNQHESECGIDVSRAQSTKRFEKLRRSGIFVEAVIHPQFHLFFGGAAQDLGYEMSGGRAFPDSDPRRRKTKRESWRSVGHKYVTPYV